MGEKGLPNIPLQLVLSDKVTTLAGVGDGGTAHMVVNSDTDGIVTFTMVPMNVDLRVKVVQMPAGAVPTLINRGNETVDSDLNSDLTTDSFRLSGGGAFTARDIGISMPGSVIVRYVNLVLICLVDLGLFTQSPLFAAFGMMPTEMGYKTRMKWESQGQRCSSSMPKRLRRLEAQEETRTNPRSLTRMAMLSLLVSLKMLTSGAAS